MLLLKQNHVHSIENIDINFTLRIYLFGAVKLTKYYDLDKYFNSEHDILFAVQGKFSLAYGRFGKNVMLLGAEMSSSVNID